MAAVHHHTRLYCNAYLFDFSHLAQRLVRVPDDVGERLVEFHNGARHEPRLRAAVHASVHGDGGAKFPGRPAQFRRADREQTRLAPGHRYVDAAGGRRPAAVVAETALAEFQIDQPREPEAHAHRTRVVRLLLAGQRDAVRVHLQQKYVVTFGRHRCRVVTRL